MGFIRIVGAGLLALAMTGCAVTPQQRQSLSGYTQAMAQVDQSADMFLTDFANGVKVQQELAKLGGAQPERVVAEYPSELVLPDAPDAARSPEEAAVAQMRRALAVVRTYNENLVALAEGRPEAEIKQGLLGLGDDLKSLASVAGVAFPPFAPFAAIGANLLKMAQDADNRRKLEEAVRQGQGPVHTILDVLAEQAPISYRLSVVGTQQAQSRLRDAIRRTAPAMKSLLARQGPPTDPAVITRVSTDGALLAEMGRQTKTQGLMTGLYAFMPGGPPYDARTDAQAQVFVQALSNSAQKYAEVVARQNAYHAMSVQYVALLQQAGEAMDKLARSLTEPVDLRTEISNALHTAFRLRDAIADFRSATPPATP